MSQTFSCLKENLLLYECLFNCDCNASGLSREKKIPVNLIRSKGLSLQLILNPLVDSNSIETKQWSIPFVPEKENSWMKKCNKKATQHRFEQMAATGGE